jgi:YVTN family beta-propeller protein/VCBS repeat-containing protein
VSVLRALNPDFHTATAVVGLTVQPVNAPPAVGDPAYSVVDVDHATGTVDGMVHATDPDDDTLTYTVADGPDDGTVSVDSATGTFSYTPTAAARLAASQLGATPADKTDTFTVNVSDGRAVTAVTVTVQVTQLDNEVVQTITTGEDPADVIVRPDGRFVYVSNFNSNYLTVIDTATGQVSIITHADGPVGARDMAFNDDGSRLYVSETGTGTISIIDTSTNTRIGGIVQPEVTGELTVIGDRLYITDVLTDTVAVLDPTTGAVIDTIDVGRNPTEIALSPDRTKMYVTNLVDGTISVIDLSTATPTVTSIFVGLHPISTAVSPDGGRLYVTLAQPEAPDSVVVIDLATGATTPIEVSRIPFDVAVTPDGKRAYVPTIEFDGEVLVIDTETNTVVDTIDAVGHEVAISPDGTHVFVIAPTGGVHVISVIPGADLTPLAANTLAVPAASQVNLAAALSSQTDLGLVGLVGGLLHLLFNNTPTIDYNPADNSQDAEGVVTGTLNTADANGDTLIHTVTQAPAHGTVTLRADGGFTYTPDPGFAHTGGTDSFNVTVSDDTYFHLAHIGGGHTASATIEITVTPVNDPPAVGDPEFTIVTVNPDTGVITGTVNVTDPDGDGLSYSLSTAPDPAKGVVEVDPATGDWTFTPTFEARLKASDVNATPADQQVSFAISASDGLASTPVAVIAPVQPLAIASNIPLGDFPEELAITPNGSRVYVTNHSSNNVSVIDTATNIVIATIPIAQGPEGVAATPDGTRVYVASISDIVSVIDTATNTVTATIDLSPDPNTVEVLGDVAISPDGSRAYVTHFAGEVTVIDTATNTVVTTFTAGIHASRVAVRPDGARLYVSNFQEGTVTVVDTATYTVVTTIPVTDFPDDIVVSPDGSRVYVGDDEVTVIDTATNTVVATIDVPDSRGVAVSPDGTYLFVANINFNSVSVVDTATNTVVANIPVGGNGPWRVAVSPDGTRAYVIDFGNDGTLTVIALDGAGLSAAAANSGDAQSSSISA